MAKVLVVDDDIHIREVICFALQKAGFTTYQAGDGEKALEQHQTLQPDLVILDVLMPELDGLSVAARIREYANTPILMLSSRDEEVDRILGLDMGADDYIGKPFSPRELVARVRAHLRREQSYHSATSQISVEGLNIDPESRQAHYHQHTLELTQTEFHLLKTLASKPNKVFTRDELMAKAYNVHKIVSYRTIDSHIRRLRDKLNNAGAPGIETVYAAGFRLLTAS